MNKASTQDVVSDLPPITIKPFYNVGVLIYEGITMLDFIGPSDAWDRLNNTFKLIKIAEKARVPIESQARGYSFVADISLEEANQLEGKDKLDIIMVPGSKAGLEKALNNPILIAQLIPLLQKADIVFSICTGSLILAKAGVLDNKDATTNKRAYKIFTPSFPKVNWKYKARWVHDKGGKYISSSGISAGIDTSLYIVSRILGPDRARDLANELEYNFETDSNVDLFAV